MPTPARTPPEGHSADRALADWLVARRILRPEDAERAIAECARTDARLPDVLAAMGLLPASHAAADAQREIEELERGEVFGEYRLIRQIGRGGLSVVYQAREESTGRIVALKVYAPSEEWRAYFADRTAGARAEQWLREAAILRRLQHPNIARVFDAGLRDGRPYIAMEYVPGGTLATLAARLWADRDVALESAPLWMRGFLTHMCDVARALDAAHSAGLLHRDIKPSNILASYDAAPVAPRIFNLKLADFGLALDLESDPVRDPRVFGTPAYISPEQSRGRGYRFVLASDVWSFGVVLYEFLAGVHPFDRGDPDETLRALRTEDPPRPSRWNPHIPPAVDTVVMACLVKDPSMRILCAEDLAEALAAALAGRPPERVPLVRPVGQPEWMGARAPRKSPHGLKRWLQRRRARAEAYFRRGVARARRGDYGGAIADLSRAMDDLPDRTGALFHRALCFFAIGGWTEMESDCDALLALRPNFPEAYVNRGIAHRRLGRHEEALRDLDRALECAPPGWPHRATVEAMRARWSAGPP